MNDQDKLYLHRLSHTLEIYRIDNGPMGESAPFKAEAAEIRNILARQEIGNSNSRNERVRTNGIHSR